jgi:hypothetical protein
MSLNVYRNIDSNLQLNTILNNFLQPHPLTPEKNYKYERFKANVALLKKKFFRAYIIGNMLGIDKGVFSKYINGGIIPGDDTLDKFNSILEERLKEVSVAKEPSQVYETKRHAKDMRELKTEMTKMNRKQDRIIKTQARIIALLLKKK